MPVAEGLLNQPILRDSAAAVAAPSRPSVRMPGAAQDVAAQSSAGIRLQTLAAALNAIDCPPERVSRGTAVSHLWVI